MKNIGKPCAGEPHARFDEGGLKRPHLLFHSSRVRQTDLKDAEFAVSSLLYLFLLTTLENALREQANGTAYDGSFIAHWLQAILYYNAPAWAFAVCYTVFGALVLVIPLSFQNGTNPGPVG